MKNYKIIVDYDQENHEDEDSFHEEKIDGVWLDTGDKVVELPSELLPYLEEADILGIA